MNHLHGLLEKSKNYESTRRTVRTRIGSSIHKNTWADLSDEYETCPKMDVMCCLCICKIQKKEIR